MTRGLRLLALFLVLFCSISAWAQLSANQVKTAYQAATRLLDAHCAKDCIGPDDVISDRCYLGLDDEHSASLLDQEWSLVGEWSSIYLNEHPSATAEELETAIKELGPEIEPHALGIAEHTFLVSITRRDIGNVFIVSAVGKSYKMVWNIKDASSRGPLAAWSTKGNLASCEEPDSNEGDKGACGPVVGAVLRLPDDLNGNARFYIDARYPQYFGEHIFRVGTPAQLSIWKWDGKEARPLVAHAFRGLSETKFEDDILSEREVAYWEVLGTCGGCARREVEWRIRIGREGVEDLGRTGVIPELDVIDELYDRVDHNLPITALAAPAVAKFIRKSVGELQEMNRELEAQNESSKTGNAQELGAAATEDAKSKDAKKDANAAIGRSTTESANQLPNKAKEDQLYHLYAGMIGGCYYEREANLTKLCLSVDEIGSHLFTLKKLSDGRFYVSAVQELGRGPDGLTDPCGRPDEVSVCKPRKEPRPDE